MMQDRDGLRPAAPSDCGMENCGICRGGRDYRGMRWRPEPIITMYTAGEQKRGLRWWYTSRELMEEALDWPGP